MKKLAVIHNTIFDYDGALLDVVNEFDRLREENPTVEYKDIHISHGFFGKTWVVLVYEYDDTSNDIELLPESFLPEPTNLPSKYIGMPAHIDPSDPDWREKLALWNASTTSQEALQRKETKDS